MSYHKELYLLNNGKDPSVERRRKAEKRKQKEKEAKKRASYSNLPTLEQLQKRESTSTRKPIYTHPKIVKHFINHNIHILSFYYKLKQHYKNSIIYEWNPHKISKRCGISYYLASKYTKLLIKHGLAEYIYKGKKTHIRLKSMLKIYNELIEDKKAVGWIEIDIKYTNNIKTISDGLRNLLTYKLISDQQYLSKMKDNYKGLTGRSDATPKELKKFDKKLKRDGQDIDVLFWTNRYFVGMRSLGRLLNMSHYGARKFLSRLEKRGVVKTRPYIRDVRKVEGLNSPEEYAEKFHHIPGHFYRGANGKIRVNFGTQIIYTQNNSNQNQFSPHSQQATPTPTHRRQ